MKKKSQSLLLLVMTVLLLVVISSRVEPRMAGEYKEPAVTDDPVPETPEPEEAVQTVMTEPEEPIPLREIVPGISLSDWNMKLANNTSVLPASFAPNVQKIRDDQYFDSRAAENLEQMLAAAEAEGYTVNVRAAYRPFSTQAYLFNGRASQIQWGTSMTLMEAETEARKVVAYPGTSEHQLGLCADIMDSPSTTMDASAANLPLLHWLTEHCAEYGFILRYPENKKEITGWYEPWHFRYVGTDAAKYIMENDLCLEEFIEKY